VPNSADGLDGLLRQLVPEQVHRVVLEAGVERVTVRGVGEAGELELVAVDTAGPQPRHEDATAAERHLPRRAPVAIGPTLRIRDAFRAAQARPILFHHRAQHLLASLKTETEERGARVGEDVEQRALAPARTRPRGIASMAS
jgi:hypothetical protein